MKFNLLNRSRLHEIFLLFLLLETTIQAFICTNDKRVSPGYLRLKSMQQRAATDESDDGIPRNSLRDRRRNKRNSDFEKSITSAESSIESEFQSYLMKNPNEDAPCYVTPSQFQSEEILNDHIRFYGFDTLFPTSNLGEEFDQNGMFRTALRIAARDDYYVQDVTLTEKVSELHSYQSIHERCVALS